MEMKRLTRNLGAAAILAILAAGCSPRDPVTRTPVYHDGTPTNRSSVQSWEINREPFYTQPGVNGGTPVTAPMPHASERGFEPYDPLASRVYQAIAQSRIDVKYITVTAKNGVVVLDGSLDTGDDVRKALEIASHIPGVTHVRNELTAVDP